LGRVAQVLRISNEIWVDFQVAIPDHPNSRIAIFLPKYRHPNGPLLLRLWQVLVGFGLIIEYLEKPV
jgi:hypothetical protein